jgi:DNA-directed RNA polymerase specialized sigma24 family protein
MYGHCLIQEREAGLTYKAIAIKYNIPIGTVKSRINRWKAKEKQQELEKKEMEGFESVS